MRIMRQDMERVRILMDLLKKREEAKRDRLEFLGDLLGLHVSKGIPLPQNLDLRFNSGIEDETYSSMDGAAIDKIFGIGKKRKGTEDLSNRELKKIKLARQREREDYNMGSAKSSGEAFNQHCHHCKKRRPKCAICPFNKTHRYCSSCVQRHFDINYDQLAEDSMSYWSGGCPKCDGTCPCAVCRNQHNNSSPTRKVYDRIKKAKKDKHKVKRERERREQERERKELESERMEEDRVEKETEVQESLEDEEDQRKTKKLKKDKDHKKKEQEKAQYLERKREEREKAEQEKKQKQAKYKKKKKPKPTPKQPSLIDMWGEAAGRLFGTTKEKAKPKQREKGHFFAEEGDVLCHVCRKSDNQHKFAHCSTCNKASHTYCQRPVLSAVPKAPWHCAKCTAQFSSTTKTVRKKSSKPRTL